MATKEANAKYNPRNNARNNPRTNRVLRPAAETIARRDYKSPMYGDNSTLTREQRLAVWKEVRQQPAAAPKSLTPLRKIPMEQRSRRSQVERSAAQRTFGKPSAAASRMGRPYVGWSEGGTHPNMFTIGCSGTGRRDHGRDVENYQDVYGPEFEDKFVAEDVLQDHIMDSHRWSEWFNGDSATRAAVIQYMQSEEFIAKVKLYS